ncbi:MAG: hypothetical protein HQL75_16205 [Magnetococcales bacterium]|nr:hypothetical protein [Magnetococcales bacterium]
MTTTEAMMMAPFSIQKNKKCPRDPLFFSGPCMSQVYPRKEQFIGVSGDIETASRGIATCLIETVLLLATHLDAFVNEGLGSITGQLLLFGRLGASSDHWIGSGVSSGNQASKANANKHRNEHGDQFLHGKAPK